MKLASDRCLEGLFAQRVGPGRPQVRLGPGVPWSDRDYPALTGRSGTQRARRLQPVYDGWHLAALMLVAAG